MLPAVYDMTGNRRDSASIRPSWPPRPLTRKPLGSTASELIEQRENRQCLRAIRGQLQRALGSGQRL